MCLSGCAPEENRTPNSGTIRAGDITVNCPTGTVPYVSGGGGKGSAGGGGVVVAGGGGGGTATCVVPAGTKPRG